MSFDTSHDEEETDRLLCVVDVSGPPTRRAVRTSDGASWSLRGDILGVLDLAAGVSVTAGRLQEMARESLRADAREACAKILCSRRISKKELGRKLSAKGFTTDAIENAMAACATYGLLNEETAAAETAEGIKARGHGSMSVKARLIRKGFDRESIEKAASATSPEAERASALEVARKKKASLDRLALEPEKRRARLARFLQGRGFNYDVIAQAMEDLFQR